MLYQNSKRFFLRKVNALLDFKDRRIEISNTVESLDEEDMQPELYFKNQLAKVFCTKLKPNKPWFSKVMRKRSKDSQHPIKKQNTRQQLIAVIKSIRLRWLDNILRRNNVGKI